MNPKEPWKYIKNLGPTKRNKIPKAVLDDEGNIICDVNKFKNKWGSNFENLYLTS